jgi:transcriptional regulator with XRE-family HTH domain
MATRPFRRRRLGRELLKHRKAANLTAEKTAKEAGVDPSTVTRIEAGSMGFKLTTIRALLDVYNVPIPERKPLLELARESGQGAWWHSYGDVLPDWFEVYVDLEAEASEVATWDTQFINGLVQTEEYARALFLGARPEAPADGIERQIELRMVRQKRVLNGELFVRMILDELALRRTYGDPEVVRVQIEHLLRLAELRNVSFQILPATARASIVGSFHVMEFPKDDDPSVVYIEHEHGSLYLEKPKQVAQYSRAYDRLRAAALSPEDSVVLIAKLVKER